MDDDEGILLLYNYSTSTASPFDDVIAHKEHCYDEEDEVEHPVVVARFGHVLNPLHTNPPALSKSSSWDREREGREGGRGEGRRGGREGKGEGGKERGREGRKGGGMGWEYIEGDREGEVDR